jgi:glycosyltransferase involved in cell wall biosynthesis
MMLKTLAIIPCLNEEISIVETMNEIKKTAPEIEIWVVDNKSTDKTLELAKSAGARIIKCEQIGKGFALRKAFSLVDSSYSAIFMVDGDATYSIDSLPEALKLVSSEGIDMVIGKRVDAEKIEIDRLAKYRIGHKLGNKTLSFMFRILFKIKISDVFSGWRVFSPGFIKSFMGGDSGFEIEAELNTHAYVLSAAVSEIPVQYFGRRVGSKSKLKTYSDGFKIIRKQLQLFRNEKPLSAFTLLSSPWLFASGWLFNGVLNEYLATGLVPRFPSLIAATGMFILSGLLWIAGVILERVRLLRVYQTRTVYSQFSKLDGLE